MDKTLRDMALFVEVAKAGAFAKAAERVGVPKSTLSRRVAELEAELGVRLLDRSSRQVSLTEAGRLYFNKSREIIEAAELATAELRNFALVPRGTLRISMTPDFATAFMVPLCVEFGRLHPDIDFDLDLSPRHVDLVQEQFDLAIRIGPLRDSDLISNHLCNVRAGLFATPECLSRHGEPHQPSDLADFPCVVNPNTRQGPAWSLTRGTEKVTVSVQGRFRANNPGVMRRLAMMGAGIIALDETMAAEDLQKGRLRRVLPDWSLPPVPVTAVTPSRLLPAKTRLFIEFLRRELKNFGV